MTKISRDNKKIQIFQIFLKAKLKSKFEHCCLRILITWKAFSKLYYNHQNIKISRIWSQPDNTDKD